jgi:hypothetical protein
MGHSQPTGGCSRDEDVKWLQPRVVDIDVVDAPRDRGRQPVDSLMCREASEIFGKRRDIRGLRDVRAMAVQLIGRLTAMARGVGESQIVIDPASGSQFGGRLLGRASARPQLRYRVGRPMGGIPDAVWHSSPSR